MLLVLPLVLILPLVPWFMFDVPPFIPTTFSSRSTVISTVSMSVVEDNRTLQDSLFLGPSHKLHCSVTCRADVPCEYSDESIFRIIVLTFNRPASLMKNLNSVRDVDSLGDKIDVEIWIDRYAHGTVHNKTLATARNFIQEWKRGQACVHIQEKHVHVRGQWIDTWRPRNNTKEIALILEDDIDVSPHVYRWLKALHEKYDQRSDVSGYTLQMENVQFKSGKQGPMIAPKTETVFMYPVTGTWGFSPHNLRWREFQDWYHEAVQNKSFHPYVPEIISTTWYKAAEKGGSSNSIWEMWHHYFNYEKHLYCVYSNLRSFTGKEDVLLSANRKERGSHYNKKPDRMVSKMRMSLWQESYINFPEKTIQFHYNGTVARRV